jgi:micrococcal nuclease
VVALSSIGKPFTLCRMSIAKDCVIDGDTIELEGERVRMIDYDSPEIFSPKCASEAARGERARLRLLELLNSGAVEVQVSGARDEDVYGRKLRLVLVDGRSVGDTLIREGLAWPWEGRRHVWCS